ncbi:SDR family oxidoreductase [Marivirga sp. S37H4]|uniref:SDR family oxidoreductase n=1 Tax=Marivirga aurantiaca TaxID=2802615 RepID=A0A935C5Y5_9BACT|nr:SDR family oxidoreductase [Marivirga aurantiaca]MBK6264070.1 SDR family oxidoreductase [Marivirga aurantiaca]
MTEKKKKPAQKQEKQPGKEHKMSPEPKAKKETPGYKGSGKLKDKVAIITGGDSGIGRAVAVAFAREGADVVISYLEEDKDAKETKKMVEEAGKHAKIIKGDISKMKHCQKIINETMKEFGKLDIVVNNAAQQYPQDNFEDITEEQLRKTFETNVFSQFFIIKAALPHLKKGASIINSTSVTAFRGSHHLIDYASTKGAIVAFTRSLSANLTPKGIRVNGVAPGPIWTPLIPSSFSKEKVDKFGLNTPMGRPGEPSEVAPSYVFLASEDSSYFSGQFLHPNGGEIINT